jgi:hypothetical protein
MLRGCQTLRICSGVCIPCWKTGLDMWPQVPQVGRTLSYPVLPAQSRGQSDARIHGATRMAGLSTLPLVNTTGNLRFNSESLPITLTFAFMWAGSPPTTCSTHPHCRGLHRQWPHFC